MLLSKYKQANEAGCDEAGRGCLAGPVVAAAVIFAEDYTNELINDSKKMNEASRNALRKIIERDAIAYAVAFVDNHMIDKINIQKASFLGMHRAIDQLSIKPTLILVDGNRFDPYPKIQHECIVKGDSKYLSIAAASILAKTYRDEFMIKAHEQYPNYKWNANMGYPTKDHYAGIKIHGITELHRKSFRLERTEQSENNQIQLF